MGSDVNPAPPLSAREISLDREVVTRLCGWFAFIALMATLAIVVYQDDLQFERLLEAQQPTIYNRSVFGVKILDLISVALVGLTAAYLLLQDRIRLTMFHREMWTISLVYVYAAVVGVIYGLIREYDLVVWFQDARQTLFMVTFFFLVFHLADDRTKWNILVTWFLTLLVLKNLLIAWWSATGVGKMIGDWAIRSSQNAEFAYFPMMFFPLLLLLLKRSSTIGKFIIALVLTLYLYNALLGIYRTVWVMIMLGSIYLLTQLDLKTSAKLVVGGSGVLAVTLAAIAIQFPRFLDLAWNFKFASIFDWSVYGDRSNSTRVLEVTNVVDLMFRQWAFLQGLGLGAWWDDTARRLLPDFASGFTHRTRFRGTHMWYVTQFLKVGLVGMFFYWRALYRISREVHRAVRQLPWERWERSVVLGLNVGLICAFISSADFVRLFLIIGVNLALMARFVELEHCSTSDNG